MSEVVKYMRRRDIYRILQVSPVYQYLDLSSIKEDQAIEKYCSNDGKCCIAITQQHELDILKLFETHKCRLKLTSTSYNHNITYRYRYLTVIIYKLAWFEIYDYYISIYNHLSKRYLHTSFNTGKHKEMCIEMVERFVNKYKK